MSRPSPAAPRTVSVIIPAWNEAERITQAVQGVRSQQVSGVSVEVIVVDDGSSDETAVLAATAGAQVITRPRDASGGNPGAARNLGVKASSGDPIVFLDADCTPRNGWLAALLSAHEAGAECVGGSVALPPGLPASARWDYYCCWYHTHPRRPRRLVAHHPPCNLSVRRAVFERTSGFTERLPVADGHEELAWQAQLRSMGTAIDFEPRAVVAHWHRPGMKSLLARMRRWGYSAMESKADNGGVRWPWFYRSPRLAIALSLLSAPAQAVYIIWCWLRAGVLEPLLVAPVLLIARMAYSWSMAVGGLRWLRRRGAPAVEIHPRWS